MKTMGQVGGNPEEDFTEFEERKRIMATPWTVTAEKHADSPDGGRGTG